MLRMWRKCCQPCLPMIKSIILLLFIPLNKASSYALLCHQQQFYPIMNNSLEADQVSVNRLWDIEANRTNHLKNLYTIYKDKEAVRINSEKDHIRRQKQLEKYQLTKLNSLNFKNKSNQDKINYQNSILRNKILEVYREGRKKKSRSVFLTQMNRNNPFKIKQQEQVYQTNLKIGERLSEIKSQVKQVCNFQEHAKKSDQLFQLTQKKSPKKKAYLKNLTKKKYSTDRFLPDLSQGSFFL